MGMTAAQLLDQIAAAEAEWEARPRLSRLRLPGLRRPDPFLELLGHRGPVILGQRGIYLRDPEPDPLGAPVTGAVYGYTREQAEAMRAIIEAAALADAGLADEPAAGEW